MHIAECNVHIEAIETMQFENNIYSNWHKNM